MKRVGTQFAVSIVMVLQTLFTAAGRDVLAQGKIIDIVAGATAAPMDPALGTILVGPSLGVSLGTRTLRRAGFVMGARAIVPAGGASAEPDCVPLQTCLSYRSPQLLVNTHASAFVNVAGGHVRVLGGVSHFDTWKSEGSPNTQSWAVQSDVQYRFNPVRKATPILSLTVMRLSRAVAGRQTYLLPTIGVSF